MIQEEKKEKREEEEELTEQEKALVRKDLALCLKLNAKLGNYQNRSAVQKICDGTKISHGDRKKVCEAVGGYTGRRNRFCGLCAV